MSEYERETEFLREFISRDHTAESQRVRDEIKQLQNQVRVLHRAMFFMAALVALAIAGLGYATIFSLDYPDNMWRFVRHFSVKVPCALGLASLASLLCFAGLGVAYRKQLNGEREKGRRLAERLLASQTGAGAGGSGPVRPDLRHGGEPPSNHARPRWEKDGRLGRPLFGRGLHFSQHSDSASL